MTKIFVDLDSLLDTRLGTLVKADSNYLQRTITEEAYYTRTTHHYGDYDAKSFKALYANRDVETLSLSGATMLCKLLARFVLDLVADDQDNPAREPVSITVNTYPYQLSNEELEAISNCVVYYAGELARVELVYMSNKELTPSFLKKDYNLVILYEYAEWLETQSVNFAKLQLPKVTLLIPKVSFLDLDESELAKLPNGKEQPYDELELILRPLLDVQVCELYHWCIIPPLPNLDKATMQAVVNTVS